ncbi:MAG TPA: hypothetical protein VI585_27800 [Candidatus Binatia bacterium]
MNVEEQQLKRRVEERQQALTEKVNSLKERVEQIKRMTDVRSAAKERPAIMLAGSVLVGFIAKKLANHKSRRHANDGASRMDSGKSFSSARTGGRLWEPIVAAMTAVATRTAIGLVNDMLHKRDETGRRRHNSRNKL